MQSDSSKIIDFLLQQPIGSVHTAIGISDKLHIPHNTVSSHLSSLVLKGFFNKRKSKQKTNGRLRYLYELIKPVDTYKFRYNRPRAREWGPAPVGDTITKVAYAPIPVPVPDAPPQTLLERIMQLACEIEMLQTAKPDLSKATVRELVDELARREL